MQNITNPRFPLGDLVVTANAENHLSPEHIVAALSRHAQGDWGDLCEEDTEQNERALQGGSRLFSSYRSVADRTFWIITEADRSVTTVLLPNDY
jgi:hypothetical protein